MQSFKPNNEIVKNKTFDKYYNIYDNPPEDEIQFEEFQLNCARRMQILKFIEEQQSDLQDDQRLNNQIIKKLQDFELSLGSSLDLDHKQQAEKQYKNDEISHFILRVAYSNSEDKISWFVRMETLLFKARLQNLNQFELNKLIQELNIDFENLDKEEFLENKQNILNGCQKFNKPIQTITNEDFIKVSFLDALAFIPSLKVFIKRGIVYLRRIDLPSIILQHFKKNLNQKMIIAQNNYDEIIQQDIRAADLLKQLPFMYLGKDYIKDQYQKIEGKLSLNNLGYAVQNYFPPCMRNLYEGLIKDHHLRHDGRIQLGLFLKGAGLSLDDQMAFWKREFTKKISAEKFEKEYSYNIRHNYGKEGGRKDYKPKNCVSIIQKSSPGDNDYHGCPFKTQNQANLTKLLVKMGIRDQDHIDAIMMKKNDKHFQIACKKTFEFKNPNIFPEGVGQHPNSYFEQSQKIQKKQE